jgi:hypothetical protein
LFFDNIFGKEVPCAQHAVRSVPSKHPTVGCALLISRMTPDLGRPTHLVIPSPGTSIECDEGSVRRYLVAERRLGYASVLLLTRGGSICGRVLKAHVSPTTDVQQDTDYT